MNEKDVMSVFNSMDEDLLNEKIDELLAEKGESMDMDSIKEKAMRKLNERENKKKRIGKRALLGAALVATLAFTTVYADEITEALKSFFNKSTVYSTVVNGSAYYLSEEVRLNEEMTLTQVSVSKDRLDMVIRTNGQLDPNTFDDLDITAVPRHNSEVMYAVGGLGGVGDDQYSFSFYNATEENYHIEPFDAFDLTLGEESYPIVLTEAEAVKVDESLSVGVSEIDAVEEAPLIAHAAGTIVEKDGKKQIQLIPAFEDSDLRMSALGEPEASEFKFSFENTEDGGVLGFGTGAVTKPIMTYDYTDTAYALTVPEDTTGGYVTIFDIDSKAETPLTVKLPAILAHYEKEVASLTLPVPKEGEIILNQELNLIIQQAIVKSVKRVSENTAVVELELNTGSDGSVTITDIGAYSADVAKADVLVKGNTAVMTMTFDPALEEAAFRFSYPHYVIRGNWSIMLGE